MDNIISYAANQVSPNVCEKLMQRSYIVTGTQDDGLITFILFPKIAASSIDFIFSIIKAIIKMHTL